jgi:hypothetical protein
MVPPEPHLYNNRSVAMSSSGSLPTPVGPYWYENLGEDEFQKLCHVLIAGKYDSVTCYPVGPRIR